MKTIEEIFKNNLIRFRERSRLTQDQLAEKIGIPLRTYQTYEAENPRIPQDKNRKAISAALRVPEHHLFVDMDEFAPMNSINPEIAITILTNYIRNTKMRG